MNTFINLINISITAGWLIIIVIVLRFVLKTMPKRVICYLWGIVAIRFICPFSITSSLSLLPATIPIRPSVIHITQGTTIKTEYMTQDPITIIFGNKDLLHILFIIWLLGVVVLTIYALSSFFRMKQLIKEAVCLRENIWLCDNINSPFIFGIIKPKIFMSSSIELKPIPYVVAHEQAHLKRKDPLWKLIGFLLLCIYWFNPLIWIAYILFCRDVELACDEYVIKNYSFFDRKQYAEALLQCSTPKKAIITYPLAFGEIGVKERIKNVLNYKKPKFWIVITGAIICIIFAVCFLSDPVSEFPDNHDETVQDNNEKIVDNSAESFGLDKLEDVEPIVEDNWPQNVSRVTQNTTAKDLTFDLQIDNPMTIVVSCITKSGNLDIIIENSSGKKYFEGSNMKTGDFEVELDKTGTYTVTIQADNHTGGFEISSKDQ